MRTPSYADKSLISPKAGVRTPALSLYSGRQVIAARGRGEAAQGIL
jgi:hypothetical protein